ncbi:MAG: D-alanyl-D-alanine carboxypeptidase, partial [Candidatus Binatia bacterium]
MSVRAQLALGLVLALVWTATAHAEPPLQALAREVVGVGQGVLVVAEDGTVLAAVAVDRAVHPASVTKVATSLAMLQRLGPEHRFTTSVRADGEIAAGVLHGNLVVEGSGDPFLVNEGAFQILERLHARGLRTIDGRVQGRGSLLFDWERDPTGSALGRFFAGNGAGWTPPAGSPPLRELALAFGGRTIAARGSATTLATYRSPPLLAILKALNGYSNNVFHLASDAIGGPSAVTTIARAAVPAELRDEIVITNGAGAGTTTRISPRAAVALVNALDHEL